MNVDILDDTMDTKTTASDYKIIYGRLSFSYNKNKGHIC